MGKNQLEGYSLWLEEVNRRGGILGRRVDLAVKDDQSDPRLARRLYEEMAERVDFFFGPYSSPVTEAVPPVAERHRRLILIGGAAADRLWEHGYRYVIGVYTPCSRFTVGFFELLVLNDLQRVAILYADDAFSTDLARASKRWAERFEIKVVFFRSFKKGTVRLDDLLLAAKEAGAEVLMVCGHFHEAVDATRSLKRIRWQPVAFYASVGPALQAFYDELHDDADLVFSTSLWEPIADFPGARQFYEDYISAYGKPPGYHAALAYATGEVLRRAIEEAGSTDTEAVRLTLLRMDAMTLIGRFGVDSTGKQVRHQSFVVQWQHGRREIVWPEALRTAPPIFSR